MICADVATHSRIPPTHGLKIIVIAATGLAYYQ